MISNNEDNSVFKINITNSSVFDSITQSEDVFAENAKTNRGISVFTA